MRSKKPWHIILAGMLLTALAAGAKEGLWTLPQLPVSLLNELEEAGVELEDRDLYSETQPSLKDQIVVFSNGYSGVLLSEKGLVLTNYRAVADRLEPHERATGVAAGNDSTARALPQLSAELLVSSENVSWRILPKVSHIFDPERKAAVIDSIGNRLCTEKRLRAGLTARIQTLGDHRFFLNTYRHLPQVRLIYTPAETLALGSLAEEDNFGPMHGIDIALVRLYSESGECYQSPEGATLGKAGFEEDDPVLVMGYPNVRRRLQTAACLEAAYLDSLYTQLQADSLLTGAGYPSRITRNDSLLKAQQLYRSIQDELVRLEEREQQFNLWAANSKRFSDCLRYGNVTGQIDRACQVRRQAMSRLKTERQLRRQSLLLRLEERLRTGDKPEHLPDEALLSEDRKRLVSTLNAMGVGCTDSLLSVSAFGSDARYQKALKRWKKQPWLQAQDPLCQTVGRMDSAHAAAQALISESERTIESRLKLYNEGLEQFHSAPNASSDGDLLLRLSYGSIRGFKPIDGVSIDYCAHLSGIGESNPYNPFSRWARQESADSDDRILSFWIDADYAGRQYGAGVYNERGELLGILSDANTENRRYPYRFNAEKGRYLVCDIRFVAFMIGQERALTRLWNELHWGGDVIHVTISEP
ncbi:MAG: S46 family peptidase [Paludibacteraceae bacterium]|nr:S46 family peptidase [Paludibacteraceae bacterium]